MVAGAICLAMAAGAVVPVAAAEALAVESIPPIKTSVVPQEVAGADRVRRDTLRCDEDRGAFVLMDGTDVAIHRSHRYPCRCNISSLARYLSVRADW